MRSKKNRKTTPEEIIRQAVETRMEMNFDYQQIQDRLDIDEITRAGAVRHGQQTVSVNPIISNPSRRPAIAAVLMTALILGATLGTGGVLIAHFTEEPTPPVSETAESTGEATPFIEPTTVPQTAPIPDEPDDLVFFYADDTLTWEGVTYTRTNVMVPPSAVSGKLGEVTPCETDDGHGSPGRTDQSFMSAASTLDDGTSFYEIQDYSTAQYVAAQTEGGYILYMVENAETPDLP